MDGAVTLSLHDNYENPPVMLQSSGDSSSSHSTPSPVPVSTTSDSTGTGTASSTDDSSSDLSLSDIFGPSVSHAPTSSSLPTNQQVGWRQR